MSKKHYQEVYDDAHPLALENLKNSLEAAKNAAEIYKAASTKAAKQAAKKDLDAASDEHGKRIKEEMQVRSDWVNANKKARAAEKAAKKEAAVPEIYNAPEPAYHEDPVYHKHKELSEYHKGVRFGIWLAKSGSSHASY
jgi:phage-related minor tail protein